MLAQGRPPEGTRYLGFDAAGVVDEVGEGVTDVAIGDDVFGLGTNTQAEYAVLNAWALKPASLDWAVAAAAGVVVETAERVLRLLGVTEGTKLFIDGGAGGVGPRRLNSQRRGVPWSSHQRVRPIRTTYARSAPSQCCTAKA
jgi:NADPH:quinone reductase-like Zn-dependent oxidoreductase